MNANFTPGLKPLLRATIVKCGCGAKRCEPIASNEFVSAAVMRSYSHTPFQRVEMGRTMTYWHNASFFCLTCGKSFRVVEIHGRTSATPCSGVCTHAKGGSCDCSCGGKNHGRDL